jgi:hypothetical protein
MTRLTAALDHATCTLRNHTEIGPIGVCARLITGLGLIYLALVWNDGSWIDALFGVVAMPAAVTGLLALRARRAPGPLRATGTLGHLANCAVFVPLFLHPATSASAMLSYGGSLLVAAAQRSGGCEVTAIPNAVLDRDDQVGCMVFAPIDLAESRVRRSPHAAH